jgi:hypothetical protein
MASHRIAARQADRVIKEYNENVGEHEERLGRNEMSATLPLKLVGNPRSFSETLAHHQLTLKRGRTEILQLNLGKLCN